MPAKGTRDAASLPARIRLWMLDHPGDHRPADVATGLGQPGDLTRSRWVQKVANAMSRLARDETLVRVESADRPVSDTLGGRGPGARYRLPAPAQDAVNA